MDGTFWKAQDYSFTKKIIFQDNIGILVLKKNGKASSAEITKHINIHYLFVTERIQKG